MGFPLYVTCCFSLAAFNILSLCLVFVSLISMCLSVFLLGFILCGTLCHLDSIDYFLFHGGENFNYNLFKNFLISFLFFFFFWDPYNSNVCAFDILSLCLVFISLISMCLGVFLLGFILYGTLCAS